MAGEPAPDPATLLTPLSEEYIAGLRDYSVEEMRQRAVTGDDHTVGRHLCPDIQAIIVFKGQLEVTWNEAGKEVSIIAPERSVISIPANSWRRYRAVEGNVEFILTTRGDQRKRLYWDEAILHQAREHNRCLDPDGYVADADILPATARRAGKKSKKCRQLTDFYGKVAQYRGAGIAAPSSLMMRVKRMA